MKREVEGDIVSRKIFVKFSETQVNEIIRRAAEVHQGLPVSWKQMCDAAFLPAAANRLQESQDVLEPLLRQLGVELVRQNNWRKGAALPGFRVARSGRNEGAGEEQPDRESEPEDLTALDGDPEEGEQSECDCCTAKINTDNEGLIVDGSLLCAKCHADDQIPRCSGCGETEELPSDEFLEK